MEAARTDLRGAATTHQFVERCVQNGLTFEQTVSSLAWLFARPRAAEAPETIRAVAFDSRVPDAGRKGAFLRQKFRAKAFAHKAAAEAIERVVSAEHAIEAAAQAVASARVVVVAHDLYSADALPRAEGGAKFFGVTNVGSVVDAAFAPTHPRVDRARRVLGNGLVRDGVEGDFPCSSLYVSRVSGGSEFWESRCRESEVHNIERGQLVGQPYALVVDVDGKVLGDDYSAGRRVLEEEGGLDGIVGALRGSLDELTKLSTRYLVFRSTGEKPSYRIYVRFAAPPGWAHSKTLALVFREILNVKDFVNERLLREVEFEPWFRPGLIDGATYHEGFDRFVGMAKLSSSASALRFVETTPLEKHSCADAVEDWTRDPRSTLLTSLALVFDSPVPPVASGFFVGVSTTHKRKRFGMDGVTGAVSLSDVSKRCMNAGEAVVRDLVTSNARRDTLCVDFKAGDVVLEHDEAKRACLRILCAEGNTWCPYRDLAVNEEDGRFDSPAEGTREHSPMSAGKLAFFVSLDERFPRVVAHCFGCNSKCPGKFVIGRLNTAHTARLMRALVSDI